MSDDFNFKYSIAYSPEQTSVGRNAPAGTDCQVPTYYVASWKGIEFYVDTTSDELGRRGDVYEYPLSDWIGYKDLGRRARRFKAEGYLIGTDQVQKSRAIRDAADSPEPGTYVHPMYGSIEVACLNCVISADYRRDKKRTKLAFEFVEAGASMAPYEAGANINRVFEYGSAAVEQSISSGTAIPWAPTEENTFLATDMSNFLAQQIEPAIDEFSFDAIDGLEPATQASGLDQIPPGGPEPEGEYEDGLLYPTFWSVANPINIGTAEVRRLHLNALERLRDFNAYVVQRAQWPLSDSAAALVMTTRLAMIRDYAVAVAQKTYDTVKDALDDLDFIMQVYDEEEEIASQKCDDALVNAIYKARAMAAEVILARNIRLPGVTEFPTHGFWPSLVVAHKLYNDARRYQQVENYNPTMPAFAMGRSVIAPAR